MSRIHRTEIETRDLVAEAVIEHVSLHGLGAAPDLPMERILEEAGVSRASAYRIWPGKAAFGAFALEQCAAGHAMGTLDSARARELAEAAMADTDRLRGVTRFVMEAAEEELTLMLRSARWRAFVAFQAMAFSSRSPEIEVFMSRIDAEDTERLADFYARVAAAWGLRAVSGVRELASVASLIVRSTVGRIVAGADADDARRTYVSALGALVRGAFEPVPGSQPDISVLFPD